MSCGHDGCTCGPDPTTTDRQPLPRHEANDTTGSADGCCGGHGDGRCQHEEPPVAAAER